MIFILLIIVSNACNSPTTNSSLLAKSWTKHVLDENLIGASNIFVTDLYGNSDLDIIASGHFANTLKNNEIPFEFHDFEGGHSDKFYERFVISIVYLNKRQNQLD